MNVYFACSITGGRRDEAVYQQLVDHMLAAGHQVPTADIAGPAVHMAEQIHAPDFVYARDVAWIEACDALVAEVSTPSHGVGYEIAYALNLGKPVLALYREGAIVSKMITGNDKPTLRVHAYGSEAEAVGMVDAFLGNQG